MHALQIFATGTSITTGVASASATIPNTSAGTKPKFVRLCASVACYAKVGVSGSAATPNDILINPETPVIVFIGGATHIAAIQLAGAGVLNVVPLENS